MRGAGRWQSSRADPACFISPQIARREADPAVTPPVRQGRQRSPSFPPLIPEGFDAARGSGRLRGATMPFVAWLCAWPVTPPRMAGFFMGPWGAVPGCFGCLCRTRCARVPGLQIASHNVPYRQNHPPKESHTPKTRRQKPTGEEGGTVGEDQARSSS